MDSPENLAEYGPMQVNPDRVFVWSFLSVHCVQMWVFGGASFLRLPLWGCFKEKSPGKPPFGSPLRHTQPTPVSSSRPPATGDRPDLLDP